MTGTLILLALSLVALAVYLLAEHRDDIRAWVEREPFDLDRADGVTRGRCTRPNCTIDHEAFWGKR